MKSIAVIGGGITGLCAAFRLHQLGWPVTLYEAAARAGGVIQSIREDGFLVETGPNTLLETSPKIAALIQDLRLGSERIDTRPAAEKRFLVRGGRVLPLPNSAWGFLRTPLFSPRAKMRLALEPFIRRAPAGREETLADFVRRRIGQEFLDYAINPLVAGVYAGDPERLSVREAFPKLHALEQNYGSLILGQIFGARARKRRAEVSKAQAKKFSFESGLQTLPDRLRFQLGDAVQLESPVSRIQRQGARWIVASRLAGEAEHSAVLFAGAARHLAEIRLETGRPIDFSIFKEIQYPPVASIALGFRREQVSHPLDGFGMLAPAKENLDILGSVFSSSLFPNRAPGGHALVTSFIGGCRNPDLARQPMPTLIERTRADLERLLGARGQPVFARVSFYAHAIPQYECGYRRFRDFMTRLEELAPGFFIAGHFRDGISLSDSIVSGLNAGDRIEYYLNCGANRSESDGGSAPCEAEPRLRGRAAPPRRPNERKAAR